jgi:hypothetical protein
MAVAWFTSNDHLPARIVFYNTREQLSLHGGVVFETTVVCYSSPPVILAIALGPSVRMTVGNAKGRGPPKKTGQSGAEVPVMQLAHALFTDGRIGCP